MVELERDPGPALGEYADAAMAVLAEPLADELTRGEALRFGALLHDVAKPQTRAETPEGRITFMGHDAAGAELARAVLARLRTSERLQAHVAALARHHLRLGFLVHERPLVAPPGVPLPARVRARRGRRHRPLGRRPAGDARAPRRRGDRPRTSTWPARCSARRCAGARRGRARRSCAATSWPRSWGSSPGPQLGELLAALDEASFAGEIATREQAVALARTLAEG